MSSQNGPKKHSVSNSDKPSSVQFVSPPSVDGDKDPKMQMLLTKLMDQKHTYTYKRLVVPMSMRSIYWKCYGFPASEDGEILTKMKLVCLLCKTIIAYNRNTSNLRMHLQNKHPQELIELEANAPPRRPHLDPKERRALKRNPKNSNMHMYSTVADGTVEIEGDVQFVNDQNVSISEFENDDTNIRVFYKGSPHSSHNNSNVTILLPEDGNSVQAHPLMENKPVLDAIAEFLVLDLQMPDIVEGKGFQKLLATLRSPCEIPVKSKLVEEVIPKVYETFKESVLETLHEITHEIALSVEEWKSSTGEDYITVSVHFQQIEDDNLYTKVLATLHCSTNYDTSYWAQQFDNLFEEWNLRPDKIKAVVMAIGDRGEIITALSLKGLVLIPCLVHSLQEVCMAAVFDQSDVQIILQKCRALLALITRHNAAHIALRIQEQILQFDEVPLTADYPKVWISSYAMLEQMLARRSVIETTLENIDPATYDRDYVHITDNDWGIIEDVINVLEPFKVTIMTLSEEKTPLISLLKPLLWQLVSTHLKIIDTDSQPTRLFKTSLCEMLTNKYNQDEPVNVMLQIATTLDPRFKTLPNVIEESRKTLNSPIKDMLQLLIEENEGPLIPKSEDGGSASKKSRLSGMELLLGDLCATKSGMPSRERANLEIVQYQSEATAPLDQCPLTWWQKAEPKCPNLARLAAQYNCIPATAIPPARIPLENQIAFHMKRANLSPDIVDQLLFLNSNHSA